MGKTVFLIVLNVWLFIGVCLMIGCLRRKSTADQVEKTPVIVALVCLVGGPIILIFGLIEATIETIKERKNMTKS